MSKRPTTKKQRDRIYARAGLKARTPEETAAYLAMIKAQGEEFLHRHARLAADYAEDAERRRIDADKVSFPGEPMPEGYRRPSLEQRIAERTEALYQRQRGLRVNDYPPGYEMADEFGKEWDAVLEADRQRAAAIKYRNWPRFLRWLPKMIAP